MFDDELRYGSDVIPSSVLWLATLLVVIGLAVVIAVPVITCVGVRKERRQRN